MRALPLALTVAALAAAGLGAQAAGGVTILASGNNYDDLLYSVGPGETVTFRNLDPAAFRHSVTSGVVLFSSGQFNTGLINGGTTTTFTAPSQPGEYKFFCSQHVWMHGVLRVG